MFCICGKKLRNRSVQGDCYTLACDCGKSYRIPILPGSKLPFPWERKRHRVYTCKKCGVGIEEKQAKQTFNELGRAMCTSCQA